MTDRSKVVPLNHAELNVVGTAALDRVQAYGESRLVHVKNISAVRRYIRAEARRRGQPVSTRVVGRDRDIVLAWAEEEYQTPAARAFLESRAEWVPGMPSLSTPFYFDVEGRA